MAFSLFISDLHLDSKSRLEINNFIKFCNNPNTQKADNLFILGDFFESYLGDDISLAYYAEVITLLKKLAKKVPTFIIKGNRDFLLANDFEKASGVKIIPEPYLLNLYNKKYLLMHGDSLCTDDVEYQQFRKNIRDENNIKEYFKKSKTERITIAKNLRENSKKTNKNKPYEIMDVNKKTVAELMSKYPNTTLIHGHTHRQNIHNNINYQRIVLGDWHKDKISVLTITNSNDISFN